ncbi:MAG: hypothetical protein K5751_00410 [Treponemataceae bacterium]|nr:hypothetical protein [Treponemataceae bacterium]
MSIRIIVGDNKTAKVIAKIMAVTERAVESSAPPEIIVPINIRNDAWNMIGIIQRISIGEKR